MRIEKKFIRFNMEDIKTVYFLYVINLKAIQIIIIIFLNLLIY